LRIGFANDFIMARVEPIATVKYFISTYHI